VGGKLLALFLTIEDNAARGKAERLYLKYRYLMFSEANKILSDTFLAEDAVQQAFEKIIKNLHKIDEENVPATRSFLVIICRNVSINIYNSKQYLNKNSDHIDDMEIESSEMSPEDLAIDNIGVERIADAIKKLPEIYRDVLLFKHFYKYSREEIAKTLDVSFETVKKRLQRAKKMLAISLDKGGEY
jgi:RNA polymerase sigma-70 factor (ECF subfamily)